MTHFPPDDPGCMNRRADGKCDIDGLPCVGWCNYRNEGEREARKEIYRRALEQWGVDAQVRMAAEECAELIKALMKMGRQKNGSTIRQMQEEMCDVAVMLEQLRNVFPADYGAMEAGKLRRISAMLDGAGRA